MTNEFRKIRRGLDLSQSDCAKRLDVSAATIHRVEKGDAPVLYVLAIKQLRDQINSVTK